MIAWNELLYALIFLNDRELFTMPIKINTIFNDPSNRLNAVMAASTIMTLRLSSCSSLLNASWNKA
jgi:multiple sugar transport system permease protein